MGTLVVVGAQWGDEGKGKVVDVLATDADIVARFAGGNNAGHTLVVKGRQIVTHLIPSGCLYPGTLCVLGPGMVIDPEVLEREVTRLQSHGLLVGDELRISFGSHLILPFHRVLDGLREDTASGDERLGTTRRGVGPAYEAKAGRRGVRVRDLYDPRKLRERLEQCKLVYEAEFERLGARERIDVEAIAQAAERFAAWIRPWVCDVGALCRNAITAGQNVLFEGAQGAMLDVDHGTYPFVTSSTTTAGGACTGIGIGPTTIDEVWGITKAYTTRVGAGPFPTKLHGAEAERLREAGSEYGATTGRPRDCGWLDLPALRHAARLNGLSGLCVTKLDVLAMLPEVKVCVAYEDGLDPGTDDLEDARPVHRTLEGWGDPELAGRLRTARTLNDVPAPVRAYLDFIEDEVGVAIVLLSVGSDRDETIPLREPFP